MKPEEIPYLVVGLLVTAGMIYALVSMWVQFAGMVAAVYLHRKGRD